MKKTLLLSLAILSCNLLNAQYNLGLVNGNYAGVSGIGLQPASVADNRYQFDFNLISTSIDFNNNYLGFSRDYFINNRFSFKDFKNYEDFKTRVLVENDLQGKKAYFNLNNRTQLPLSFLLSTGKKSGIALNIQSRTSVGIQNMDADFAKQLYNFWGNGATYGKNYNLTGMELNALNWMEVGLTYGRVLMNEGKHFLKFGVTAKYLGGISSWNLKANNVTLRAENDSSLTGFGSMQYSHSASEISTKINSSYRPDASSWGGDIGVVYEFRGRINKFLVPKYNTKDDYYESRERRDKNKYSAKLGVSLLDVGVLNFNSAPLARNFKFDVNHFNLAQIDVRNIKQFDTLISKNVTYTNANGALYSVAMPTALSAQLDIHVFKGFYVNGMVYKPFNALSKNATYRIKSPDFYAVTPRWESRFIGVYAPFSINSNKDISAGATLRVGPLFVGTANMLTLIKKDNIQYADIHAGLKIPIAHGKPSRAAKWFKKVSQNIADTSEVNLIEASPNRPLQNSNPPIQIIINNYNSSAEKKSSEYILEKDSSGNYQKVIIENINKSSNDKELDELENELQFLKYKLQQKEQIIQKLEEATSPQNSQSESSIQKKNKVIDSLLAIYKSDSKNEFVAPTPTPSVDTSKSARVTRLLEEINTLEIKQQVLHEREKKQKNQVNDLISHSTGEQKMFYTRLRQVYEEMNTGSKKEVSKSSENEVELLYPNYDETRKGLKIESQQTSEQTTSLVPELNKLATKKELEGLMSKSDYNNLMSKLDQLESKAKVSTIPQAPIGSSTNNTTNIFKSRKRRDRIAQMQYSSLLGEVIQLRSDVAKLNEEGLSSKSKLPETILVRDTVYIEKPIEKIVVKTIRDTITNTIEKTNTITKVEKEVEKVTDNRSILIAAAPEVVLFDVGQIMIKPIYFKRLMYLADMQKKYPDLNLEITGHTDNSGNVDKNRILATNRANAVKMYLQKRGVTKENIIVNADGQDNPIAENSTKSGKSQNRRVEIRFSSKN